MFTLYLGKMKECNCSCKSGIRMGLCLQVRSRHYEDLLEHDVTNQHDRCFRRGQVPVK